MNETSLTEHLVEGIADASCCELFRAYGLHLQPIRPSRPADSRSPRSVGEPILVEGLVGFTSPSLAGVCIVAATESPLRESARIALTDRGLADWVGEVANQLAGRIKNRLLSYGVRAALSVPLVLRGDHVAPVEGRARAPLSYAYGDGRIFVWVEVDVREEAARNASSRPRVEVVAEGSVLLFDID